MLASHECELGALFVVDSIPWFKGFSLASSVFLSLQKSTLLNSSSILGDIIDRVNL